MLKFLSKRFFEYCPKFDEKNVKTEFHVTRRFSCGNFFSRNNYTFFLSFRDFGWNVFGLSLNRFRQLWKFQFMCPQICFVGKNIVSSVPDFEPKLFGSPPKKSRWFSKLHLVCSGEDFEENYLLFWKRKKNSWFCLVFLRKLIGRPVKSAF